MAIVLKEGVETSLADADVVIRPPLGNLQMHEFTRGAQAVASGVEGAQAMSETLQRYSVSPQRFALHRQELVSTHEEGWLVDEVRLQNDLGSAKHSLNI